MKKITTILLGILVWAGLQFGLGGCIAEVGGRGYYGGGPWYHDGPWMDGGRWGGGPRGGVGIDIHPPGFRR
jgi:hypothetical protein